MWPEPWTGSGGRRRETFAVLLTKDKSIGNACRPVPVEIRLKDELTQLIAHVYM